MTWHAVFYPGILHDTIYMLVSVGSFAMAYRAMTRKDMGEVVLYVGLMLSADLSYWMQEIRDVVAAQHDAVTP